MTKIVFLSSSDIHGYIMPTDYQKKAEYHAALGLSRVSSAIKAERAKFGAENVVVTDAGDCLQGSPLASYVYSTEDLEVLDQYTDLYNLVGYDARCLGNHDFDYGLNFLKHYLNRNQAPFLNDNILDAQSKLPALGQSYQILVKNGIRIGLLGVTTEKVPDWEPAANVAGLKFTSAYAQVKHYAKILRKQVDVLAVIYHGGFEADPLSGTKTEPANGENEGYRILTELPEVDVLLTGHQHRKLALVTKNTAIVQPGYRGEAVGEVILEIDDKSKEIRSKTARLLDVHAYLPDQALLDHCSELEQATQSWLDQPLAHLPEPAPLGDANHARLVGAPFINLLQEMQLFFTQADVSATAVMSDTAPGFDREVTMRDILLNYPYANQLCLVRLTGRQLREIIEYSLAFLEKNDQGEVTFAPQWRNLLFNFDVFYPVNYQADISRPPGHRLTQLDLEGKPLADEKNYHLAVNSYRAHGGGFYPGYSADKIEKTVDKDYVQMFQEFLTQTKVEVDRRQNYRFN